MASSSQDDDPSVGGFEMHESMEALMDKYDGFILDQFGCIHDGTKGLPGAPECVKALHNAGRKLAILSNSSSSSEACKSKLPKLGFNSQYFKAAVTSGQEAGIYVRETYGNDKKTNEGRGGPTKVLFLTWRTPKTPSPTTFLDLCGGKDVVEVTDKPSEAELILLHGVDVMRGPGNDGEATETSLGNIMEDGDLSTVETIIKECAARNVPMICANPDFIMVKPDGSIGHMPGKIADLYTNLGGKCTSFGKPHVPHFEACVNALGVPKDKVAHVGDSLHHDVAGANASGIASVFVTGGIHREELGAELGTLPDRESLEKLFKKHGQTPTHVIPLVRI